MNAQEVPEDFVPTLSDLSAYQVDKLFQDDMRLLGNWGSDLFLRLRGTADVNEIPERTPVLGLLSNALLTATAALELWRRGFLLQVGTLLRNANETVAVAAVITSDASAGERHGMGKLDTAKALTELKTLWPDIGATVAKFTGYLSREFVHIGTGYRAWFRFSPGLTERHVADLRDMLPCIKMTFYLIDLLSEMVCWQNVAHPRHWQKTGPQRYERRTTEAGREWVKKVFKEQASEVSDEP